MSLSQADLQVIQTVFGKTAEELSGAISSDSEVSLDLRLNGRVLSQEAEQELRATATDAGVEIGFKKLAKAAGIELGAGEKDADIIAGKLKTGITTALEDKYKNMTPTEELVAAQSKAAEWEQKYGKLNETYEGSSAKVVEWEQKYSGLENEIKQNDINSTLTKAFPDKMKMDRDDALLIARNAFDFERTDNGIVAKRNGQIVTNPVGDPEKIDNVIKSFVEEKQWIKSAGMGGGDRGAGGSTLPGGMTDDAALSYLTEKGIDPMSREGSEAFSQLTSK